MRMTDSHSRGQWPFMLAGLFAALFCVNVALRILFIKYHVAIWRLGDVGEMLLVLVAMALFVSGVLSIEETTESSAAPINDNPLGGNP
jgi:hypothetical protein